MYFKNNRTALVFLLAMLAVAPIKAQVAFGDAAKFNDGWLFRLTDDSAIVRTDYDDSEWRKLSLPHDWSIEGQLSPTLASCTGYLPGGIGWYRKHFRVEDNATRHYIYFEGVYNRSEVYLNGHLLGRRPNGYVSFLYDMTPYLKEGDNVLAVRVDLAVIPIHVGIRGRASIAMYGWWLLPIHILRNGVWAGMPLR